MTALASVTVSSRTKLANLLGVSLPMVDRYIVAGMPGENGCYDVEECKAWLAAYRASSSRPTKGGDGDEGDLRERRLRAECDKLEQQARREKMKADIEAGRMVRTEDVVNEFADFLSHVKPICESFPDDFARELPDEQRVAGQALARQMIDRMLRKLASWEPIPKPDVDTETSSEGD